VTAFVVVLFCKGIFLKKNLRKKSLREINMKNVEQIRQATGNNKEEKMKNELWLKLKFGQIQLLYQLVV